MAVPCVAPAVPVEHEPVPRPVAEQVTETIGAGKHVEDKGEKDRVKKGQGYSLSFSELYA